MRLGPQAADARRRLQRRAVIGENGAGRPCRSCKQVRIQSARAKAAPRHPLTRAWRRPERMLREAGTWAPAIPIGQLPLPGNVPPPPAASVPAPPLPFRRRPLLLRPLLPPRPRADPKHSPRPRAGSWRVGALGTAYGETLPRSRCPRPCGFRAARSGVTDRAAPAPLRRDVPGPEYPDASYALLGTLRCPQWAPMAALCQPAPQSAPAIGPSPIPGAAAPRRIPGTLPLRPLASARVLSPGRRPARRQPAVRQTMHRPARRPLRREMTPCLPPARTRPGPCSNRAATRGGTRSGSAPAEQAHQKLRVVHGDFVHGGASLAGPEHVPAH